MGPCEIDDRNGWYEAGDDRITTKAITAAAEGLAETTRWQLENYSREEEIDGVSRVITMRPAISCICKTFCVQLSIRPSSIGLSRPSLQSIAAHITSLLGRQGSVSKQSLGRVFIDFKARYPLFVSRMMRS